MKRKHERRRDTLILELVMFVALLKPKTTQTIEAGRDLERDEECVNYPWPFWLKSHFLFERARCFSRSRALLVLALSKCLQPSFCCFPSFLMARVSDGTNVPISPAPASSSNMGSPNGSLPDLEGTGFRASTMEEKINDIYLQLPIFMQNAAWIENCLQTLAQTVDAQTTKITNIEQSVGSLVARVTSSETNAASGSSSPDSTRSWNMLGQSTGSTATGSLGSHGPGSSDDNRNTRRRLDASSSLANEHARSAVLLRFPCEQYHKGITKWINIFGKNPTCQPTKDLLQFILKQVPCRSGLYMNHEPNVETLLPDIKMMASPMRLTVPFAASKQLSLSAYPNQLKTERLENNLRLCGVSWLTSSKFSSLIEMTKVHS